MSHTIPTAIGEEPDNTEPAAAGTPLNAVHMVGNAHLDPAWMWQWGEGMEAFIATCRAALDRMEETPEFIFTCSSAAHYRWIEELEPELFERIRERVAQGRWAIVGGWWTQADCNIPSGEGFVRQALLAQRYFLSQFGRTARTGYSPDAFGHSLGLPQLLTGAGMDGYIFCRPDPTELTLPSPLFRWRSPDGSAVIAYRVPFHYNMYETSVPKKVKDLERIYNKGSALTGNGGSLRSFGNEWCLFYGVGNHGGGPTREHIRHIIEIDGDPDHPRLLFSDPDAFLASANRSDRVIPDWSEDLQLNAPGCYSAHSTIKKLNRQSESLLAQAERFGTMAALIGGFRIPVEELRRAWENVCFNHFHDILCGVAIKEAMEDAIEMYGESLTIAKRITRYALQRLARGIDTTGPGRTLVVFNSHTWDVKHHVTFELWQDIDKSLWSQPVAIRVTDDAGIDLPCQTGFTSGKIGRDRVAVTFNADVPALGWRCYRVFYGEHSPFRTERPVAYGAGDGNHPFMIENEFIRLEINPSDGTVTRILEKNSDLEFMAGPGALPVVIDDPTDTWGHGVTTFDRVIGTFGAAETRSVEHGPTHAAIRVRTFHGASWFQQDFRLYAGDPDIHVDVKLFWAERNRMLKLAFPTTLRRAESAYESAYCVSRKPCDGTERPGGAWGAIDGEIGGRAATFAIINDAKHSYSATIDAEGASLFVGVLRSPAYALHDPHPSHPNEDQDYLDQGIQRFRYIIRAVADERSRADLPRRAMLLNAPLTAQFESEHPGLDPTWSAREYHGIAIDAPNVVATVVKQAESGMGWIIRLFETEGQETETDVRSPLLRCSWHVKLRPHQVSTWRIVDGAARSVTLIETNED